ncbi:heterokaryon incompatibility protein [Ilyonectria robusta]
MRAYRLFFLSCLEDSDAIRSTSFEAPYICNVFDAVIDLDIPVEGKVKEDRDDVVKLIDKYGNSFPLEGVKDILSCIWFSRLWIIQEVYLAPTVLFICSSQSLCFDCFCLGLLFFNIYNTHWTNYIIHVIPKAEVTLHKELLNLNKSLLQITRERKAIYHYSTRHSLYDIIINYNMNSEHPKISAILVEDRIFGVMGIAKDRIIYGLEVKYTDM